MTGQRKPGPLKTGQREPDPPKPGSLQRDWERGGNNFDFLRLALAVLVIYSHCFPLGAGGDNGEPLFRATHGQMTGGAVAVDFFFIISGFLITASAERSKSIFSYLKKRVARIYPAFVVVAALCVLFVVPASSAMIAGHTWLGKTGDVVFQTLRLREFDYTRAFAGNPYPNAINGSVWSIQYEFWCYIGVALLLTFGLLRRRWLLLGLFLAAVAASVMCQAQGWLLGGKFLGRLLGSPEIWARLLPLYMAGVVLYLFRGRVKLTARGAVVSLAALTAASWVPCGWTAVFPFAGSYLAFYLAFAPWLKLQRFGRFGDFSYGAYLYAFPIEQLLMQRFGHPVQPMLLFVCATPLTLLAAVASWYGVERRFLRPGRRKETIAHAIEAGERERMAAS